MALLSKKRKLKVLFVASEAAPFAKEGGLGSVMYSLPRALKDIGHDARVMIPRYLDIDQEAFKLELIEENIPVPSGSDDEPFICNVKRYTPPNRDEHEPVTAYFLENEEYYEQRANIYGYADDTVRWALLSKGVLEFLARHEEWTPDIIVAADWQTGLIPNYLQTDYKDNPKLSKIAVVFSIHNLSFQGMMDHHHVMPMDYDSGKAEIPPMRDPELLKLNCMRRGIMYADVISTVSETYAHEITEPELGEKMDDLLRERRSRLFGILNGIDYRYWNPEVNSEIDFNFNKKNFATERIKNKTALQKRFGLEEDEDVFMLGVVSRLTGQKGFDLLFKTADPMLNNINMQFVILGGGDGVYMDFFQELQEHYPKRVATHLAFDRILPRAIFAAADAVLIPSRYEPSGLTQMEAMSYGTIPIVRKTGGLADSVKDFDPSTYKGNGFVFKDFDGYAMYGTIVRAIETYRDKKTWQKVQKNAFDADFSWRVSAEKYVKLFRKAREFMEEDCKKNDTAPYLDGQN